MEQPLYFQRQFQFTPGVNTLLRFRYEHLRGFCETCGMITHDSGNCLIQKLVAENQAVQCQNAEDQEMNVDQVQG